MRLLTLSALVLLLSIGVKGIALIKEMVIAGTFGLSYELDIFIYMFTLISFIVNVLAGALGAAYLPRFVYFSKLQQGKEYASSVWGGITIVGVSLTLILMIISWSLMHWFPLHGEIGLLLIPLLAILAINTWATQTHIASNRTLLATVIPFITPLVIMGGVSLVGRDIMILAYTTLFGAMVETLLLVGILCWKEKIYWRLGNKSEYLLLLRQMTPLTLSALLTGGALVIEQTLATSLPAGSVAAYAYGQKIPFFVISLGIGVIAGVIFPYFSSLAHNHQKLLSQTTLFAGGVAFLGSIVALGILFFSESLVRLLYARGAFDELAVGRVALVQSMFAIQIGLHLACAVYIKGLSASGHNKEVLKISAIMIAVNGILDLILMNTFGVAGLALASSLTQVIALGVAFMSLKRVL